VAGTVLVTTEAHFVFGTDGQVSSTTGVDSYAFWRRYLEVFDRVVVAARTHIGHAATVRSAVEGPGVTVARLPDYRGPWQYLRVRVGVTEAVRRAVRGVDVLCLRAPGQIAGLAWRLRGRRPFAVEVVGDPMDSLSRGAVRSALRPIARIAFARELRAMCRTATAVSYVTSGSLQRRYPTPGWQTSYSSIELEDDAFMAESEVERRLAAEILVKRGTKADPWRLVLVGSLANRNKGADIAVDALAICRERGVQAVLLVVGEGCERPRLERRAETAGVADAVSFLGQLPAGRVVRDVLDRSDMFVLPSRAEGVPRAMLEAMARGVPCVGSSVGGIPELLPAGRCVTPASARALADVVVRLSSSPRALLASAQADRLTALRYRSAILQPRRRAFYQYLRAALTSAEPPRRAIPI
jgi:phosphatidylinositol alpha-1,6-mannosyltransferase